MPIKVLVVDDSSFFRRRVSEIIERDAELTVIGTAKDGQDAIEQTAKLKPDVITMDVEMPVMDGITAVRKIMAATPTSILMFSSLTHDGAKATLDALEAGALDFLPKKFEDIARNRDDAVELLQNRIKQIARQGMRRRPIASKPQERVTAPATIRRKSSESTRANATAARRTTNQKSSDYKILAIGTSTGGPVALQKILTQVPGHLSIPILLIQHMPAAFTPAFATRLNNQCAITVKHAENGDMLKPGHAYLAPGGCQMMVEGRAGATKLKVIQDDSDRLTYKPSVDVTFGSISKVYGDSTLAVILTGMGSDGKDGARMLKSSGAKIWAQDEASCVVYGMPQAVASAGISEESIALKDMAKRINEELGLK